MSKTYQDRITPKYIATLKENQIFVFPSNEQGIHGAGAALAARKKFGAILGQGVGRQGQCYAIPTKSTPYKTLPISSIESWVYEFEAYAHNNPDLTFLVVEIGCGLAGFTPEQIAPLFKDCIKLDNVHLPESFWKVLVQNK